MEEEIIRDIEQLKKELDYFRDKIEKGEDKDLQFAKECFTEINRRRHDVFLHIVQDKLGIPVSEGDENPKDKVLYELKKTEEEDMYELYLQRFKEERYRRLNKTPDIVNIKRMHGMIDSVEIMDVAVTFDPAITVETKMDKYRPYLELFKELNPSIKIVYYNIRDKIIGHVDIPNHQQMDMDLTVYTDFEKICDDGEQIKMNLRRSLDPKTLEDFNYWLKDSRTLEDITGIPILENKFSMSTEEFMTAMKDNIWCKRFFDHRKMKSAERELFIRSIYVNNINNEDNHEISKFCRMVLKENNKELLESARNPEHNEKYFKNLDDELMADTITHKSEKLPREPSSEEITTAFEELSKRAESNFNGSEKGKILSPFYFGFSKNGEYLDRIKGKELKKERMKNLYSKIKNSRGNNELRDALLLILEPSNIPDSVYYESFIKGESFVTQEGNVISNETFKSLVQEENRNIKEAVKRGEVKHTILDALNFKRIVAVSMKKGEVIQIRPSKIKIIDSLLDSAGVGRKSEKTVHDVRKVKSLKFWDEEELIKKSNEFRQTAKNLYEKLIEVGNKVSEEQFSEFKPTPEQSSESDSDASESSVLTSSSASSKTSASSINDDDKTKKAFERGLKFYMRYNEVLWENLSFAAHMGGNGFRIVQGITHNSFLIVLPCESILKGQTGVPFINVTLEEEGDIFEDHCDINRKTLDGNGYKIHVSCGRRLDRPRLQGYMNVKPMFYTAVAILNHYRAESNALNLDMLEQTILALIIGNVNINTSSILDNTRYMLENTMADYSFCKEFIEDKFMVPCKNIAQMYLFQRVKQVLINVREETSAARVKKSTISEDGSINFDTSRVINAKISSYIFDHIQYKKPEFVIGEVYTLFFSIQKGLHGHFHNLLDTHKTPIEIQNMINEKFGRHIPKVMGTPKHRLEFNPKAMVLATIEADKNLTDSNRNIRQSYSSRSKINETPLMIKTMTSTRSLMVEDNRNDSFEIDNSEIELNPALSELNQSETKVVIDMVYQFDKSLTNLKRNDMRKKWRKMKQGIEDNKLISNFSKMAKCQTIDFIKNKIKVNFETKSLEFRRGDIKNDMKLRIRQLTKERHGTDEKLKFYTSGTVLTQVLESTIKTSTTDENGKVLLRSQGEVSKEAAMNGKPMFLIRQKHQRTQKDREIFVGNKDAKDILYPIEHFYKQKCFHLAEEKISEPGDIKIISMSNQVRQGFEWMAKEYVKKEKTEEKESYRCDSYHFNLDMTKWAPKDNLFKFIYMISPCSVSTFGEKLFYFACIFKMASKKLYIDEELFYKLSKNSKEEVNPMDGKEQVDKFEDPFFMLTKGFKTNSVEIIESWFQGQMNYCSSFVHAGTLLLWKRYSKRRWSNVQMLFFLNCHSDDQQSDVYSVRHSDIEESSFLESLWSMMDFLMVNNCMEISIKKSYISKLIKQFISQYNIAGEQIYLWCKPIMSSISGCPYTTLKDDMSSMFSKIAEALSKGAPKKVAQVAINEMKTILWDIYGVRTKKQKNKFSALMNIPEESLPMAFGGSYVRDFTTLAIGGPKTIDQMNLYDLLTKCGSTTERPPDRMPGSSSLLRSVQLFYITDILTSETIEEEEDNSATLTLNPFRPTKFKSRRLGMEDPFKHNKMYLEDKEEQIARLKEEKPGLGLVKPNDPIDLLQYYMVLYNTPNFKSSLAGQSPIILRLQKIINRKKGVFRFKKSGNITLEKFETNEDSDIFTPEQVSEVVSSMMKAMPMTVEFIDHLRIKYIISDPEFRVLAFTAQHAHSTSAVLRKNPIPKKKPNSSDYSNIVNRLNMLLCYFFDEAYFSRNKFRMQFPVALPNDLIRIDELFPVEFGWLRTQIQMKKLEDPEILSKPSVRRTYNNYLDVIEEIKNVESDMINYKKVLKTNDKKYKRHKEIIDRIAEIEFVKSKGGVSSILEPTETLSEMEKRNKKDKERERSFDIFTRLVNCAKLISARTQKVIFCAPTTNNELHEIALSTRTVIESSVDTAISYYLNISQRQELRGLKLSFFRAEKAKMIDFIMQASNLLQLIHVVGAGKDGITEIMKGCKIKDIDIGTVKENFKDLYRRYQQAAITLIGIESPTQLSYYVSLMDPMQIRWEKDQEDRYTPFVAHMHYENMIITFIGNDGKIDKLIIEYTGEFYLHLFNKAFKSFCADLAYKDPTKRSSVFIQRFIHPTSIDNRTAPLKFAYSTRRNEFVDGSSTLADSYMKNVIMKKTDIPKDAPKVKTSNVDFINLGVSYKSSIDQFGTEEFIKHRWFKDYQITELEFNSKTLSGYRVSDLATKNMFKSIISKRYMDLTSEEVVKFNRSPDFLLESSGTFGAFFTYKLITGDFENPDFKKMYAWAESYFHIAQSKIANKDYEDSDNEFKFSESRKEEVFDSSDNLNEFVNRFDAGWGGTQFLSNYDLMQKKEDNWNDLMYLASKYDLRSVRRAYVVIILLKGKGLEADDTVSYSEMFNNMDISEKNEFIDEVNRVSVDMDFAKTMIEECQITKFNKFDDQIFRNICLISCTLYKFKSRRKKRDDESKNIRLKDMYLSMLRNKLETKKTKQTMRMIIAVLCFHLGDRFLDFCDESTGKLTCDHKTTYDLLVTRFKETKNNLSEHTITVFEIFNNAYQEANKLLITQETIDQFQFIEGGKKKKKMSYKERLLQNKKDEEKKKNVERERSRTHSSKSIRSIVNKNPDLNKESFQDPDALLQIASMSKELVSTELSTEFTASETETRLLHTEKRHKKSRKSLLEQVNEALVEKPKTIEFDPEDPEFDFGISGDELDFLDDMTFN